MNKIERAIYDCKMQIDKFRQDRLIINAKLEILEEQLVTLSIIENDKSIPYLIDTKPPQNEN